jgi:hypothetical protein
MPFGVLGPTIRGIAGKAPTTGRPKPSRGRPVAKNPAKAPRPVGRPARPTRSY